MDERETLSYLGEGIGT